MARRPNSKPIDSALERQVAARVITLRRARDWSQKDLGRAIGMSQSAVNNFEHNLRHVTATLIEQLARAFDLPPAALFGEYKPRTVAIVGYVGANPDETIEYVNAYPDGGGPQMEAPPGTPDDFALEVRGNSMAPRYFDRDRIVCTPITTNDPRAAFYRDCAIELADGRKLLKRVEPGSRHTVVTLKSFNPGYPLITDAKVVKFSTVRWISPRG